MAFGGPVWHASARAVPESLAWSMAERALAGVGDASLGEWRQRGNGGVVHIRRRMTAIEDAQVGPLLDIRGTAQERARLYRLAKDAPQLAAFIRTRIPEFDR